MGFEHTAPVFKLANTIHVLDLTVTVIGYEQISKLIVYSMCVKYFTQMLVTTRYEIPVPVMSAAQELSSVSSGIEHGFFSSRKKKNFSHSHIFLRNLS